MQYQRHHVEQGTLAAAAVTNKRDVFLRLDLDVRHHQPEADAIGQALLDDILERIDDAQGNNSSATGKTELPLTGPPPGVTHKSV